jgi:hypothetical protein
MPQLLVSFQPQSSVLKSQGSFNTSWQDMSSGVDALRCGIMMIAHNLGRATRARPGTVLDRLSEQAVQLENKTRIHTTHKLSKMKPTK